MQKAVLAAVVAGLCALPLLAQEPFGAPEPSPMSSVVACTSHAENTATAPATAAAPVAEPAQALRAGSTDMLPIVADGATNPEKIPADLAYRHFIRAIAGPGSDKDASADIIGRRRAHLSRIGLSDEDEGALVSAVRGVGEELDRVEHARRGTADPRSAASDLDGLRVQERELLDTTRERIGSSLSVGGTQRLDAYVLEHVRKRIVIYGVLPQ